MGTLMDKNPTIKVSNLDILDHHMKADEKYFKYDIEKSVKSDEKKVFLYSNLLFSSISINKLVESYGKKIIEKIKLKRQSLSTKEDISIANNFHQNFDQRRNPNNDDTKIDEISLSAIIQKNPFVLKKFIIKKILWERKNILLQNSW